MKEKFEAKKIELVELTQEQAIELMLEGAVIPKSEDQWRPRNMHLRQSHNERKEREQRERYEQGAYEQKLWDTGIDSAQKKQTEKQLSTGKVTVKFKKDCDLMIDGETSSHMEGHVLCMNSNVAEKVIKEGVALLLSG